MSLVFVPPWSQQTRTPLLLILLLGLLTACANSTEKPEEQASAEYDPWEPMNRKLFAVNHAVDKLTFRPLAKGYRKITPVFARRGVANFFDNLSTPRSSLNNFLQGKPSRGFSELGRFLFNSTLGLGGLIDVATAGGMESFDEDFSQTFAVWGLPQGPYTVLPILGPNTVLDVIALPFDIVSDLQVHMGDSGTRDRLWGLRAIDLRRRLLAADKLLEDSQDPYITLRESFLQNRNYRIYDGDPPIDDEIFEFDDDE